MRRAREVCRRYNLNHIYKNRLYKLKEEKKQRNLGGTRVEKLHRSGKLSNSKYCVTAGFRYKDHKKETKN
jgi:hypothetical protein